MPNCSARAVSKAAWNSLPPSTWIALMGKGNRRRIEPRNCAARLDVARVCTSITSHLETTSRAVKCLSTTPGRGPDIQSVHLHYVTWIHGPVFPGLAHRVRAPTRIDLRADTPYLGGSLSTPRALRLVSIRPVIEVETCQP